MSTKSEKIIVDNFFQLMKNWDTELKKDLIIKLTESINDKSKSSSDFSSCFGAWEDERSAEEIINEIKSDRVNQREIEEF